MAIVGGDTSGGSPENVFVYNFAAGTKGPVYTTGCAGSVSSPNNGCLHGVTMTPDYIDPGRPPVKLRIQDNSLRFRLTETDVMRVKENGRVDAEVRVTSDRALCYFVASTQSLEDIEVEYTADCVRVFLPGPWVLAWADNDQVSIAGHGRVQVLVEKDLQFRDRLTA